MGERFPEFDAWLEDSKNDEAIRQQWQVEFSDLDDDEFHDEEVEEKDDEYEPAPPPPPATIVRETERVGRNDPCPCGSGKKFKKCCLNKEQMLEEPGRAASPPMSAAVPGKSKAKYPMGTVALYGPDERVTTKIVAGVIKRDGAEPILERWVGTSIKDNPKVQRQIQEFFEKHGVKSVAAVDRNMGCPHEEGADFPVGEDCPFCPFWKGKQGSKRSD